MQRRLSGSAAITTLPVTVASCDHGSSPTSSPKQSCNGSPNGYHYRQSPGGFARRFSNGSSSPTISSLKKGALGAGGMKSWTMSKFIMVLLMVVMFVAGGQVNKQQMQHQVASVEEARVKLETNERRLLHELSVANQNAADSTEEDQLKHSIEVLKEEKHELQELLEEQIALAQKQHPQQEHTSKDEINLLTAHIQRMSREQALEHFGPGPHYIEFELAIPKEGDNETMEAAYFTVELASLSLMPTTVNLFLRAVKKGLWDNGHFSQNAHHVVMGEPLDIGNFLREGVAHLAFKEHSKNVPHVPYSLGLAGNPAGPSFYINKIDNTHSHGADNESEGEPCFGHVIVGKDTIDRMVQQPNHEEHPNLFSNPIQIKTAKIMELHDVHGGVEYLKTYMSTDPSSDM